MKKLLSVMAGAVVLFSFSAGVSADRIAWVANPYTFRLADVTKDSFAESIGEMTGQTLTEADFTRNISVTDAIRHCVVSDNGVTYIFIEFPDDASADNYWTFEQSLTNGNGINYTNGDNGFIQEDTDYSYGAMYRSGNCIVSAWSSGDDAASRARVDDFLMGMGLPEPGFL